MNETAGGDGGRRGRRGRGEAGGADARRALRRGGKAAKNSFITRGIPPYRILSEEGLELIEANADTVLEETGIEFRDDPEALEIWKAAGADVKGERVRFPRGLCRGIVRQHAPASFVQHARNPARSVTVGGDATVFAPV
jgi:trimethylamine--corrinoid protein Co-methyltransferase